MSGIIRDSARGAPLADALIELRNGSTLLSTRSEQDGTYQLRSVLAGRHELTIRRIGYRELRRTLDLNGRDTSISPMLGGFAQMLDTMHARANVMGIFGVVGSATDLKPLPKAKLKVLGAQSSTETDSAGRFFVEVKKAGTYMVRVDREGYHGQLLSLTVPQDRAVETVPLLYSTGDPKSRVGERMWHEFDERVQFGGTNAAVLSGGQLRKSGASDIAEAVQFIPSSARKGLHIGATSCLFVNGMPRFGFSVDVIPLDQVEAVELYTANGDASGTLVKLWPRNVACAPSIRSAAGGSAGTAAKYVVVWLRPDQ